MSSLNYKQNTTAVKFNYNYNGLKVKQESPEKILLRTTLAHMLWEDQFYVDGKTSAELLADSVGKVSPAYAADVAMRARSDFKLRHVPLYIMRVLAANGTLKAEDLAAVVQRPDELSEFLAMYWKDKKQPLSNQVKKGLAQSFKKFNEYQLAKWDKNSSAISIRDVMFLTHPKPDTTEQVELFKKVANKQLSVPDTWETELSGGADKKKTFERLMREKKLGALAFLRNLRNMVNSGVPEGLIREYGAQVPLDRVLPFRFITAQRACPNLSDLLEGMMLKSLIKHDKLKGNTALVVDVSGSMFQAKVSEKSDLLRFDAAAALAVLCKEVCEKVAVYTFSNQLVKVSEHYNGFNLIKAMYGSQRHAGTDMRTAIEHLPKDGLDRLIVFTDEQTSTMPPDVPGIKPYIINVAAYTKGISKKGWTTISGFSEAVIDYIQVVENTA